LLNHEVCLRKLGPQAVTVELHRSLVADRSFTYAVPVDWFWEQTEPLGEPLAGQSLALRMLTPTAQVLYGSAHAMLQHGSHNTPLLWYYDLDLLIRSYASKIDWDLLVAQARKFEWGSALDLALARTHALFNTPIPEAVLIRLAGQIDRHKGLVEQKRNPAGTHTLEELEKLRSLNFYARCRLFGALLAPRPAYMRWRYNLKSLWLLPFYYLFRWWGILKDGVITANHLIQRRLPTKITDPERNPTRSM